MHDSVFADPARKEAAGRIVEAAGRLFSERGYEGVSIRDIAAAAGISKANVFHHFANKDELYAAVLDCCAEPLRQLLGGLPARPGPAEQVLAETIHGHLEHMLEHPAAIRLLLRQLLGDHAGDPRADSGRLLGGNFELAAASILEMQRQGRLAADIEPAVLASMTFGAHLVFFLCRDVLAGLPGGAAIAQPEGYDQALLRILGRGILTAGPADPSKTKQSE